MKILIAVTAAPSYGLVKGQIKYLSQQGHDVYFVSSYRTGVDKLVREEGGSYFAVEMEREMNLFKDIVSLVKIIILLCKLRPNIVNAGTPKAGLLFMIASKISFISNLKAVFTLRGLRSDTLTGFKYKLVKAMERLTCALADKVIVISPSLREHAIAEEILSDKKSVVLGIGSSNGINIDRFTNRATQPEIYELREKYNIPPSAMVFGYVGRIVRDKGVTNLYEAFCKQQRIYSDSFLVLIGPHELDGIPTELFKEISENQNVLLLGAIPNVESFFPLMDVFILFSYREGFGNVVLEAASMGIPAIVSNIPGLRDTILDHQTGLLAQAKNSDDLSEKMEKYYLNRDLVEEHGKNARVRVEKFFKNELIWKGQENLYNELQNV